MSGGKWEDEEERRFFEDVLDLKEFVPSSVLGLEEGEQKDDKEAEEEREREREEKDKEEVRKLEEEIERLGENSDVERLPDELSDDLGEDSEFVLRFILSLSRTLMLF